MPVVVLTGPRQTGKSTLAETFGVLPARRYETLDDLSTRLRAQVDPQAFLQGDDPVTIDEVQHVPELLLAIKAAVDAQKTRRVAGRFLLTGSANLLTMESVADSLAGRATYVSLWPLTRREREGDGATGIWSDVLSTPPDGWERLLRSQPDEPLDWRAEVRRGGFPVPSVHMRTQRERAEWFDGYIQTYLERDFTALSAVHNLLDVRRLMRAIALRVGDIVNQTELGRDVQLSQPRVHSYLNLLETSFQLVRLAPFATSRTTRLIKTPKAYWNDAGLALHLTGDAEPTGAHFENMVLCDLLAWRSTVTPRPDLMYWRTAQGDEVDFVIEQGKQLLPIEVKTSKAVDGTAARGLRRFLDEHSKRAAGGLVLYAGERMVWLAERILAVPWWRVI